MSKLPAKTIGRNRETQKKEFDQAVSELGSTVFVNKRRGLHPDNKPSENQGQRGPGKRCDKEF